MPKQKIQVMVEPELHALLLDLSKELGEPLSPMVNSLLQQLSPHLAQQLRMAKQVRELDAKRKRQLQGDLSRIADSLEEKVSEYMQEADAIMNKVH